MVRSKIVVNDGEEGGSGFVGKWRCRKGFIYVADRGRQRGDHRPHTSSGIYKFVVSTPSPSVAAVGLITVGCRSSWGPPVGYEVWCAERVASLYGGLCFVGTRESTRRIATGYSARPCVVFLV